MAPASDRAQRNTSEWRHCSFPSGSQLLGWGREIAHEHLGHQYTTRSELALQLGHTPSLSQIITIFTS